MHSSSVRKSLKEQMEAVRDKLFPDGITLPLGCHKKQKYASEEEVLHRIETRYTSKSNPTKDKLYHYECPVCGKWHMTKLEQPDDRG